MRAEHERVEVRDSDLLAGLLPFQQGDEFLSLPVCQDDRVVFGVGSTSWVQAHVARSPLSMPGLLLISTRKKPRGVRTSMSDSLIVPSSAMNSKLAQTR